jgi:hypothetical protein
MVGLPVGPIAQAVYRLAIAAQSGDLVSVKAAAGWDAWTWKGANGGGRIELRNETHPGFDVAADGRARTAFERLAFAGSAGELAAVLTMAGERDGRAGGWHSADVVRLLRPAGDHRDRYSPIIEDWVCLLAHARFRFDQADTKKLRRGNQKEAATVTVLAFERHNTKSATVSIPATVRTQLGLHQVPATMFELDRHDGANPEGAKLSRWARLQSRIGAVVQAVSGIRQSTVEDLLDRWAPTACLRARRARRFGAALTAFSTDVEAVLGAGTGVEHDRTGSVRTRTVRFVGHLAERTRAILDELRAAPPDLLSAAMSPPT